jgi:hypothetical protein
MVGRPAGRALKAGAPVAASRPSVPDSRSRAMKHRHPSWQRGLKALAFALLALGAAVAI